MPLNRAKPSPLVFLSLVLLLVFCWIEVDLYAPAFPQLRRAFGTTEEMVQLTLSLNFLGFFVSSLFVGPLADSLGRRPVLLTGSGIFVAGSLLCVVAPTFPLLLAGRVLQGLGVAAPIALAATILGDLYDGERQVKLFSLLNSLVTITMASAPLLGAWLSETWGWRANFVLILAGSLLATLVVMVILPESHAPEHRQPFSLGLMAQNCGTLLRSRFFLATSFGLVLMATPLPAGGRHRMALRLHLHLGVRGLPCPQGQLHGPVLLHPDDGDGRRHRPFRAPVRQHFQAGGSGGLPAGAGGVPAAAVRPEAGWAAGRQGVHAAALRAYPGQHTSRIASPSWRVLRPATGSTSPTRMGRRRRR